VARGRGQDLVETRWRRQLFKQEQELTQVWRKKRAKGTTKHARR